MKYSFSALVLSILLLSNIKAQTAADYFPANTGYTWIFKSTILDSLNHPKDSLSKISIDSFAVSGDYKGTAAKFVMTKSGLPETLVSQPYIDTNFVGLDGTTGKTYFGNALINSLAGFSDSTIIDSIMPGIDVFQFLSSFQGWYSFYKFTNTVNSEYQVYKKDTTFTLDTLVLPMRFEVKGKRLADQSITTEIGTFTCKKFINYYTLSYLIIPPSPFPAIPVQLVQFSDTSWLAPQRWVVKSIVPSTTLDLTFLNYGSYTFPGFQKTILASIPTSIEKNDNLFESKSFELNQNFPNPFNPSTTIMFNLIKDGYSSLKLFDITGKEVAVLVSENLSAGAYKITLGESITTSLSSGVYFYQLKSGSMIETKKLILLK